ncbi:MAG: CoA transferase [Chloroflexi bacterium]|nr:CoA transferase [Chloroflexota bacterium]
MAGPLSGVRILDFSHTTAGAYGTMLLADLGAEVIKIEAGEGGSDRIVPGPKFQGNSYVYLALNRNKKSILLDLRTETGKEAFHDLARVSDVVWDNFRSGVMKRLGADYATLKSINPRIVACSITGFGPSGPYCDWPSYDIIACALSGMMSITGEPGRPPVRPGITIGDLAPSMFAALGVCAALASRSQTGAGQEVQISQIDSMISLMGIHIAYYFCGGGVPGPEGSGHLTINPYGAYPTRDGYLALGPCWPRITRVVDAEWMQEDPRFKDREVRYQHKSDLDRVLAERFSREKAEDWLEILHQEDIPSAPVNTVDKAVADPQVLHNRMIVDLRDGPGNVTRIAGNPIKTKSAEEQEFTLPPGLGQHTEQILSELLQYPPDKIARLKRDYHGHAAELQAHKRKSL